MPVSGSLRDHDAGGDVAAGVGGGVLQRRQHAPEVDVLGVHVLLRRRPLHQHRRLRIAERAADEFAHAAEVDAEGGLDVGLAGQQIADHRHVVAVDLREQQRRPAVELLHDAGDFEIGIDRRGVGLQPALLGHAAERRAKAGVQHRIRSVQRRLPGRPEMSWHHTRLAARSATRVGQDTARCVLRCEGSVRALRQGRGAPRRRRSRSPGTPRRCR